MYLWLAAGIAFAAVGAWGTYQSWQHERWQSIAAAQQEKVKALGVQIDAHNKALDRLQEAAKAAQERGQAALKAARKEGDSHRAEIKRLQALKGDGKGCKEAWADIRSR